MTIGRKTGAHGATAHSPTSAHAGAVPHGKKGKKGHLGERGGSIHAPHRIHTTRGSGGSGKRK